MKSEQQQEVPEEKKRKINWTYAKKRTEGRLPNVLLAVQIKSGHVNVFLMASEEETPGLELEY